jgi:hypothetical protein
VFGVEGAGDTWVGSVLSLPRLNEIDLDRFQF